MVPERHLIEINLSEHALPWERICFDIVCHISTQSTLVGRTKLCFKKIDTIEGISSVHVEGVKKSVDSLTFNPTTLSAGEIDAPFHPVSYTHLRAHET